jgi:hypothetical protein
MDTRLRGYDIVICHPRLMWIPGQAGYDKLLLRTTITNICHPRLDRGSMPSEQVDTRSSRV